MATCPDCLHEYDKYGCSEFCATVPEADRRKWHDFVPVEDTPEGEDTCWGLYPCAECGGIIDDEFYKDRICGTCGPRVKARKRTELLKRVLEHGNVLPQGLIEDIQRELKRL